MDIRLKKQIKLGLQLIIIQQRLRQLNVHNRIASHSTFVLPSANLRSSTQFPRPHLIVRRISRINLLLVPIEDLFSVQLLRRSSVALTTCQLKRTRGEGVGSKTGRLHFVGSTLHLQQPHPQ